MLDELVWIGALVLVGSGCGVTSRGQPSGGVELEGGAGGAGEAQLRGLVVTHSDYASSNVSLLSASAEVLSESFISSSSAQPGLSSPLSGDVVSPSRRVPGNELVLIDRFPAAVLSWVDLQTGAVRAQLSVATGFASNPHDYVAYDAERAFVPRYEPNLNAGRQPYDAGNDVLVIDPREPAIVASIDLTPALAGEPAGFYPRASRALLAGGKLRVLCSAFNADFKQHLDSRIVSIDPATSAITQVLLLPGLTSCSSADLSPDGERLAVSCDGDFSNDPAAGFPDSGIVLLDVADDLSEASRFTAQSLGIEAVSGAVFASARHLLVGTRGRYSSDLKTLAAPDTVRTFDLEAERINAPLLQSRAKAYVLGGMRCDPGAGRCFVADAETDGGVLQPIAVGNDGFAELLAPFKIDMRLGLPPRGIGIY